jgi:hypothetical protein
MGGSNTTHETVSRQLSGGGRWITSGILPSALRATPLARRVSLPSRSRALSVHGDASVKAAK